MYWRLNSVKQLNLQIKPRFTPSPTPSHGQDTFSETPTTTSLPNSPQKSRRQRSSTFALPRMRHSSSASASSLGSIPQPDFRLVNNKLNTESRHTRRHRNNSLISTSTSGPVSLAPAAQNTRSMLIPSRSSSSSQNFLIDCEGSPDGKYLAGITPESVYLWTLKPFMLVAQLEYDYVEEFGEMVGMYWKPDSRALYIVASEGAIYEIFVQVSDQPVVEPEFSTPHHFAYGAGEAKEKLGTILSQTRTLRLPEGTRTISGGAGNEVMIVTSDQHLRYLNWEGKSKVTVALEDIVGPNRDYVKSVCSIDQDHEQALLLTESGKVYIINFFEDEDSEEGNVTYSTLETPNNTTFTVACYNPKLRLLSIGTNSAEIVTFYFESQGNISWLYTKHPPDVAKGSKITSLSWTHDGLALASGYSSGHIALWSACGIVLNTTDVKGLGGDHASSYAPTKLSWNEGSTELFVLGALMFGNGSIISQRGFIYAVANDDGTSVAVAGKSGFAHYSKISRKWQLIQNQLQEESIECRGGILWFGDFMIVSLVNKEAEATGGEMSFNNVRSLQIDATKYSICFFSRHQPLDLEASKRIHVPSPVITMTNIGSILLVYCKDNKLRQYHMFEDRGDLEISQHRGSEELNLADFIAKPELVRSIQYFPSSLFEISPALLIQDGRELKFLQLGSRNGHDNNYNTPTRMSHNPNNDVTESDMAPISATTSQSENSDAVSGGSYVKQVSSMVEFSLVSGVNFGCLHSIIWWFHGQTMEAVLVSLNDYLNGPDQDIFNDSSKKIEFNLDFFPLVISPERGMIIGVDQEWTLSDQGVVGLSKLPIKAKLLVHNVLDHMLSDGAEQDALMYASCFEHLPYFSHCLEMLLHSVLEREADNPSSSHKDKQVILPKVINLLENFNGFIEIVVRCARKTEMSLWKYLFETVGGHIGFFEKCLESNKLETAVHFLIVLHTLEPSAEVFKKAALRLLERLVDKQDEILTIQVVRFLQTSDVSLYYLIQDN
ncbi:WD40 repeat protein [Mycoemilia scoparia]|uniref:WD40 repeat protein n=1 Tax=Mycoemilia scoparia TaxID=417184 RepID=A0A9W8DT13_9FUNG|nr:WD40 repeat protein [Mycoemilia scoparia]